MAYDPETALRETNEWLVDLLLKRRFAVRMLFSPCICRAPCAII